MANKFDDIDALISRVLSGEATPAEQEQLNDWLKDPVNAAHFDRTRKALALADKYIGEEKNIPSIDVNEEWRQFSARVGQRDNVRELRPPVFTWARVAAAILVVAAATFTINYFVSKPGEVRIETLAETKRVDLPDGTVVTLNRNSSLAYGDDFNKENRLVQLSGEAFFDVTPNTQKPFVISSGNAQVTVVGTTFNVRAYEKDTQMTVTVETGVVQLSAATSGEKVVLKRGDSGTFEKANGSVSMRVNPDVNYNSWTTRHIEFNETSLQEVVKTLNRTYGANITINCTVSPNCVVTVTFEQQSLESVLRVLETTLNLTYRVNGDTIEITSAPC